MTFGSTESRKLLLTMVVLVVALHATAITIYYVVGVGRRPQQFQTGFVVVWILLTVAILAVYLRRIRRIRDASLRRRR